MFYDKRDADVVEALTRDSFAVHYWNHMRVREGKQLAIKSDQPLYNIFGDNCPETYEHLLRDMVGSPY